MSSIDTSTIRLRAAGPVAGERRGPGDKAVPHRVAILGALAEGTTVAAGYAANLDCAATLACVEALGARVAREDGTVRVHGVGREGVRTPDGPLDARNSGTTMRLLAGAIAGQAVEVELTGDES